MCSTWFIPDTGFAAFDVFHTVIGVNIRQMDNYMTVITLADINHVPRPAPEVY
jgi:hypothetical protein